MDLLKETKDLCKQHDIIPARSKGQNFLISEKVYDDMIATADLKPDDIVLEVGPGLGFLTTKLAERVKKVIAVELDDKLAKLLKKRLEEEEVRNVEVVNANILDFGIMNHESRIMENNGKNNIHNSLFIIHNSRYKIVANLPYNITSIFLRKFLSMENKPESVVLMLQKEVAERIAAKPPQMSLLAVSVQYYAKPEIVSIVAKENFWPVPEVDSAIIKLRIKNYELRINGWPNPLLAKERGKNLDVDKEKEFFRLVKIGFSAKRKMLKNNLSAGLKIDPEIMENKLKLVGFSPKIRAQELSVADWLGLFEGMRGFVV